MRWDSDESFPRAPDGWSAWRPPFGRRVNGEAKVKQAIRAWHPFDPVLVSIPGAEHMLPPICFKDTAEQAHRRALSQYKILMSLMILMILGFAYVGIQGHRNILIKGSISIFLLLIFIGSQYFFILRNLARVQAVSRLCSWCYLQPRAPIFAAAALMIVAGATQYGLIKHVGSLNDVIERFGLVFAKTAEQPWRYIVGPFFHTGLAHWLANTSLLLVAVGMAFNFGRPLVVWLVFFAGVYLPAFVLTFMPYSFRLDALLGVSGGVFAVYGWIAGISLAHRQRFPFGLWWSVTYFAIASAAVSSLIDAQTNWFVHVSGLGIGFFSGLSGMGLKPEIINSNVEVAVQGRQIY